MKTYTPEEAQELLEKISPWPWKEIHEAEIPPLRAHAFVGASDWNPKEMELKIKQANFIAAAPEIISSLLAQVKEKDAELLKVRKEVANANKGAKTNMGALNLAVKKLTEKDRLLGVAVDGLNYIKRACSCNRSTPGFDYSDNNHPEMGKAPMGRWSLPWEKCDQILAEIKGDK